jgi:hypothetical protein
MSDRVQVDCLKQGAVDTTKWSTRVLTVDSRTGTLTISRRGHPESVFYHSLKPSKVQRWPHFCPTAIDDNFSSTEAKRTVVVFGTTERVPDFTEEEVALVGIPLPPSSLLRDAVSQTSSSYPEAAQAELPRRIPERLPSATTANKPSRNTVRHEKLGKFDVWVLRFPSKAAYNVAMHMLRNVLDVTFAGDSRRRKRHSRLSHTSTAVCVADVTACETFPVKKKKGNKELFSKASQREGMPMCDTKQQQQQRDKLNAREGGILLHRQRWNTPEASILFLSLFPSFPSVCMGD